MPVPTRTLTLLLNLAHPRRPTPPMGAVMSLMADGRHELEPLLGPVDVVPQYGGLEVTTSSTSLQALTDAVLYLSEYPYDSTDALASRILAIVALRDQPDR